jgi:signal transduction histidine kinase
MPRDRIRALPHNAARHPLTTMPRADDPAPAPARTGWLLAWVLFWLLMLTVAVQDHLRTSTGALWKPVLWEGTSFVAATALLALMWRYSSRHDELLARPWRWFALHLRWLPLLAPGFVITIYAMRHAVFAALGQTYHHPGWGEVFLYECTKFSIFYALFVAVAFGLRIHLALAAQRQQTQAAQLAQLTQQLQPHFLFNALNTIAATIHTAPDRADSLLTRLAALLRATTDLTRRPQCTLDEELGLLDGYAAIMCERFADRVTLRHEVDHAARACRVPTLSIQPLLENAFRHGVERCSGRTDLVVRAVCRDARLRIEVEQSQGSPPAAPAHGVGLDTLRQRLAALYGARASLGLESLTPGGALAWFELPCER